MGEYSSRLYSPRPKERVFCLYVRRVSSATVIGVFTLFACTRSKSISTWNYSRMYGETI